MQKIKNYFKKGFIIISFLLFVISLASCNNTNSEDIIILYTNDTHCGIENDIGFAGIKAYKNQMEKTNKYVTLVDCGDAIQGGTMGAITKGEAIVDIMNYVGYDYAIFGNHEFDYGITQLKKITQLANYKYLCSNIKYSGSKDGLLDSVTPYDVLDYGGKRVAFIGVTTPQTLSSSTPTYFMENDEFVYSFYQENNGADLYNKVQSTIDSAKTEGQADYVILLSHLGVYQEGLEPYDTFSLVENITGCDVILDGHSHSEIPCYIKSDKEGKDVLISQTGTKLNNIGKLVITGNGNIDVGIITDYDKKDQNTINHIEDIKSKYNDMLKTKVASTAFSLSIYDNDGIRMVRSRETAIGDLVADAYKAILNADIGMINGGGIRDSINAGDITYENIISVNPFGNQLLVVKVTGSQIADMLEYMYRYVQKEYKKDGKAVGEDGSFQQVAGLKFDIDTDTSTSVVVNENDDLLSVGEERRVKNIKILKNGEYQNLVMDEAYTLAGNDYMLKKGGCGMRLFLQDVEIICDDVMADYVALINYIKDTLNGNLTKYSEADNRINIL